MNELLRNECIYQYQRTQLLITPRQLIHVGRETLHMNIQIPVDFNDNELPVALEKFLIRIHQKDKCPILTYYVDNTNHTEKILNLSVYVGNIPNKKSSYLVSSVNLDFVTNEIYAFISEA